MPLTRVPFNDYMHLSEHLDTLMWEELRTAVCADSLWFYMQKITREEKDAEKKAKIQVRYV